MFDLHVENKNKWELLPNWANFYIMVGKTFYESLTNKTKLRLVLTLPSRSYAGVFIAYGAMLALIMDKVDKNTIDTHFKKIKNLDIGTSVVYRKQDRIYRGIYSGTEEINGEERIKITIQEKKAGSLTELLSSNQTLSVQVANEKNYKLPKNPKGRENKVSDFIKIGFQNYNYHRLLTHSQLQFYYIGRKKWIKEEAVETEMALYDFKKSQYVKGNLHELLRMKELMGEQASYQSQLISSSSGSHEINLNYSTASTFTIFDGAMSYLRWREVFKSTHSVVILDRTETNFENAIYEISNDLLLSQKNDMDFPLNVQHIPRGIELMFWEVY
ncbi:hypothetical protein [Fictibacillus nanhaiensis]|uniref:hypothetical protein n=1 Tax=Fictibacillus nanhaiensis TaxID=742169 RepID=UPI003C26BFA7